MDVQAIGQAALGNPTLLTACGTVTAALISGVFMWRAGRPSAQAAKRYKGCQMNLKTMQDMQARGCGATSWPLTRHIRLLERTMAAQGIDVPERSDATV